MASTRSVFGVGAIKATLNGTTRIPAYTGGSSGNEYILATDTLTVTTTDITATMSIDAAASDMGIDHLVWTPSGNTDQTFKTPRMTKLTIDVTNGNVLAPAHGVAQYAQARLIGAGTVELAFGHESKLVMDDAATTVLNYSAYKPAIDAIDGTLTNYNAFDADIDFSGIDGTATNKRSLYSPRTDLHAIQKGGLELSTKFIVANYEFTKHDSMTTIMNFGGGAVNVTIPATLAAGTRGWLVQGLTDDVITPVASGGNTIFNASSHTKSNGQFSELAFVIISNGGGGVVITSGNMAA